MDKMSLFTINVIEINEDPEWAGVYNEIVTPTNMVFASVGDAMNKAHKMALNHLPDDAIEKVETYDSEDDDPVIHGYKVAHPWDAEGETCFIVVPLKWEE